MKTNLLKKIDLKIIIILFLTALSTTLFIKKPRTVYVEKIVRDSIPYPVHDTIPVEVEVEVPYELRYEVEKLVEVKTPISADTLQIINDYLSQNKVIDTLKLKNKWGYLIVSDVLSKNKVQSRKIESFYDIPTKEKIVEIEQPKENHWYLGFGYDFGFNTFFNGANTQLLYKTKSDKMFGFEAGYRNNITNIQTGEGKLKPYIGTSIFIRIK